MKKVWFFVILAFLILIGAWSVMITVALKNQPENIEISPETLAEPAR